MPVMALQAPGEPGRIYVVEQGGYVRVLDKGKRLTKPFLDLHTKTSTGGEQGLLGIAFPADYTTRRKVYANYTDSAGSTTIVEIPVANGVAQAARARRLLQVTQPYPNHNGGNLQFGPDGLLWVGLGDGGSAGDPEGRAQNPSTLLGKIFTLDVRSARPSPKLVGIGVRNPWRYSFDRRTGDLWIGDVGQGDVEEIDVVRHADIESLGTGLLNFGWDVYEGSQELREQAARPWPTGQARRRVPPLVRLLGDRGYVYRGRAVPSLRGRYLYSDYCSRHRLVAAGDGRQASRRAVQGAEPDLVRRVACGRALRGLAERHRLPHRQVAVSSRFGGEPAGSARALRTQVRSATRSGSEARVRRAQTRRPARQTG